tara:strand:- start:180 stop:308 length:129 start_codon:yes stop_codon:yes gene_type:complete
MVSFLIGLSFIHGITARAKQAAGIVKVAVSVNSSLRFTGGSI